MARVKVSKTTKEEFKKNKEIYRSQGIKSSIGLQKHKNQKVRKVKAARSAMRESIREAFKSNEKYSILGYDAEDFIEIYNQIEKYNEKIERSKKTGYISSATGTLKFPLDQSGNISLWRLNFITQKLKISIREIRRRQVTTFYNNIKELYGEKMMEYAKSKLNRFNYGRVEDKLRDHDLLDWLVLYDIEEFNDDAREEYWRSMMEHYNTLLNQIDYIADDLAMEDEK